MSDMMIRPLCASDEDAWRDLWGRYNAFYGRVGETALSDSIVEATWTRLLDDDEPVYGLVADYEGTLIGLAHIVFHRNLNQIEDTCYLQDLFTCEAWRGRGVARKLIASIENVCCIRGMRDIYWHTQVMNATARRLYDNLARNTEFVVYRMNV